MSKPVVLPSEARTARISIDEGPSTGLTRSRSGSDASLKDTMNFYNVGHKRQPSLEGSRRGEAAAIAAGSAGRQSPGPNITGRPIISYQTQPSSSQPSAHSASILPSSAFFSPKRPVRASVAGASPALTAASSSPSARYSTDPEGREGVRMTPNGPRITRVSTDYSKPVEKLYTRRFSGDVIGENNEGEAASTLGRLRSGSYGEDARETVGEPSGSTAYSATPRPSSPGADSNTSASIFGAHGRSSTEESSQQGHDYSGSLGGPPLSPFDFSGRTPSAKASREPLLDFPSSAAKDANSSSPNLPRSPPRPHGHVRSISDEIKITSRKSVEGAVHRARLSFSNGMSMSRSNSDNAVGKLPGSQQLPDVPSSGEYERSVIEKQLRQHDDSNLIGAPSNRAPAGGTTVVPIPLEPVVDEKGRKVRNYKLHPGANRFFLAGRLVSSKDNPTPFIISLCLAIVLPILFFAFSGPFLWHHLGGGGKSSIFIFVWLTGLMVTSMCKTAWTDPGIIPRGLDRVPERKWVEDLGEGEGGWKAEPKYMRIKEGIVASKCERTQY
ncbi:hypothetical protein P7C70_g3473, partial [Phenoliferia sp. Uapishka_3]